MQPSKWVLPIIIISQFSCTSLWFAGNGVLPDLVANFGLSERAVGYLTSAVQLGFIVGTLLFAILSIADRYSPSKVFLWCAVLGALANLGIIWEGNTLISILTFRFFTGFFLAGIYPVGMKIASDYFETGLGKSLGFLVGALVIGTAFPHLLKNMTEAFSWKSVLLTTSTLAVCGGVMLGLMVPDGPYRKSNQQIRLSACFRVFRQASFRTAAFGYFGHMWELYTFWAFVPVMLKRYQETHASTSCDIPLLSFLIIGIGGIACVGSGYAAQLFGTKRTAFVALLLSCGCCLISFFMFSIASPILFVLFLLFWGMVVIADSPLFSTLVAQNAPIALKGTALTIVNSIGFFITIISIQFISELRVYTDSPIIFTALALGPLLGLIALSSAARIVQD